MDVISVATVFSFSLSDSPEVVNSRIVEAVNRIDTSETARQIPICWNFPAAAAFDRSQPSISTLRDTLLRRMDENHDTICPMGLTGAPHRALTVEEMTYDLTWSESNIWGTGVHDVLRRKPDLMIPREGDSDRYDQIASKSSATPAVGVRLRALSHRVGHRVMLIMTPEQRWLLPLVEWRDLALPDNPGRIRRAARKIRQTRVEHRGHGPDSRSDSPTILWCDVDGPGQAEGIESLIAVIGELSSGGGFEFVGFPSPDGDSVADTGPIDRAIFHSGAPNLSHQAIEDASMMRTRRKSKINTRRLLETLGTIWQEKTLEPPPPTRKVNVHTKREYVASMMGEARLAGPGVDALFVGGRFHGLALSLQSARIAPTDTLLAVRRRVTEKHHLMVSLETTSCFSFESERGHGITVVSSDGVTIPGSTITVTTDYSFVNDLPVLVISPAISVEPSTSRGNRSLAATLLLLALPVGPEPVVVSSVYPDGSHATAQLHPTDDCAAFGTLFSVTHHDQELHLAAVSRSLNPLLWPLVMVPGSPPRLAAGGRFALDDDLPNETKTIRYSVLLAYDPDGAGVLQSVLTRRLPPAIRDEISAGP